MQELDFLTFIDFYFHLKTIHKDSSARRVDASTKLIGD